MFRLESLSCVKAPAENAAQVAELQGRRKLQTSVTSYTIPSLVAKSPSGEGSAGPSADLNARVVSY